MNSYLCLIGENADHSHILSQFYENDIAAKSNCNHPQINYTTPIFAAYINDICLIKEPK